MKRWLLTLPILLAGMTGLVRADYFLIVVNTGTPPAGGMGMGMGMGVVGMPPASGMGMGMGMGTTTQAPATNPADFVGVIVETDNPRTFSKTEKQQFEQGLPLQVKYRNYNLRFTNMSGPPSGGVLGSTTYVSLYTEPTEKPNDYRVRSNLNQEFEHKLADTKNKMEPKALAEWALTHGLLAKFVVTMDKLAADEKDKADPAVVAYAKVKAQMSARVERQPRSPWVKILTSNGFKTETSEHYLLVHNADTQDKSKLKSRLDRLEEAFQTFYYWHALRGTVLSMPQEQLPVFVGQNEDVKELKEFRALTDGSEGRLVSRHEDGFFARREGIVYLSLNSREPNFEKVSAFVVKKFEGSNKTVEDFLKEKPSPVQRGAPDPWVLSVAVKALEADAERMTVSHFASRQLVYATGLLPRNVDAPEWIQYGLGSFFEAPLGSPWSSPAAPSSLHLKHAVEALEKKGASAVDILKQVVSDGFFRDAEAASETDAVQVEKARALAWGLTYYLLQMKPDSYRAFCDELNKMPRDIALDGEVMLGCFARAVGAVDTNTKKVDAAKLGEVALKWKSYLKQTENPAYELVRALEDNSKRYQASMTPR